jgi:hypothetical protein
MIFFWLINLVLLPSAAIALWVGHKEREERVRYFAVGVAYVAMNVLVLFIVPFIWLLTNAAS